MLSSERTITTPSRGPSPAPGSSPIFLSQLHIAEAIKSSPDNGATLDLTHKNLSLIGETGAQELATIVRDGPNSKDVSVSRSVLRWDMNLVMLLPYSECTLTGSRLDSIV